MRTARRLPSVETMSHPQSYEILLVPGFVEETAHDSGDDTATGGAGDDTTGAGTAEGVTAPADPVIRSAVVAATGETGASGYPRYAGEGVVADIDPATHTVEAVLVDGAELDYGLSVRIKETADDPGGRGQDHH